MVILDKDQTEEFLRLANWEGPLSAIATFYPKATGDTKFDELVTDARDAMRNLGEYCELLREAHEIP